MADNNGSRVWPYRCPMCQKIVRSTNLMRIGGRWSMDYDVEYEGKRIAVTDTHLRACAIRLGLLPASARQRLD